MGISSFIACGRSRGGPSSLTGRIASCDRVGCIETVMITSQEQYSAAAVEGWRRHGDAVRCPAHSFEFDGVR